VCFRAMGRMFAEGWQRWRGSGPGARGAAAAAAEEEAVRRSAHRGSLSHADQLHPVNLAGAFNAVNALQALWRGVVARRGSEAARAAGGGGVAWCGGAEPRAGGRCDERYGRAPST
jgi:hypothetical protein